jgi:hypothetical protein
MTGPAVHIVRGGRHDAVCPVDRGHKFQERRRAFRSEVDGLADDGSGAPAPWEWFSLLSGRVLTSVAEPHACLLAQATLIEKALCGVDQGHGCRDPR